MYSIAARGARASCAGGDREAAQKIAAGARYSSARERQCCCRWRNAGDARSATLAPRRRRCALCCAQRAVLLPSAYRRPGMAPPVRTGHAASAKACARRVRWQNRAHPLRGGVERQQKRSASASSAMPGASYATSAAAMPARREGYSGMRAPRERAEGRKSVVDTGDCR